MLKGLYAKTFETNPPKTHSLTYLCETQKLEMPEEFQNFTDKLDNLSVPTRYPEKLDILLKDFKKTLTEDVYEQAKELLQWLKKKII